MILYKTLNTWFTSPYSTNSCTALLSRITKTYSTKTASQYLRTSKPTD